MKTAADRGKILGVVLLTDGRHNTGSLPDQKARALGERRVPIYPIALGSRRAPPDVAVTRVEAPPAARQDAEIQVTAHVRVSGLDPQKITVSVHRPGEAPGSTRRLAALGQATI